MQLIKSFALAKPVQPLRVGVIGAGMMGQNHLRIYSMLKEVDLVAVVDVDEERARNSAIKYGCIPYTNIEDIIDQVDAVTIAVPSGLHAAMGVFFLRHGIHCLIEKPLALTEKECQLLIKTAEQNNAVLLVGHIEHFNPAVQQLSRLLEGNHTIHAIDVHRMSGSSKRITDVDVVMDLMIHDLEIVLSLIRQPVVNVSAEAVYHSGSKAVDYVSALLSFAGGTIVNLTASRITQNKVRKLSITADIGYITLDYSAQELLIYRQAAESTLVNCEGTLFDQAIERVLVRPAEPLIVEIQHFIQSVRTGVVSGVDGHQAFAALKVAWQIQEQIAKRRMHVVNKAMPIKAKSAKENLVV